MAKNILQTLADELEEVMDKRDNLRAEFEEQDTPLKEREEQIRLELMEDMTKRGWKFVKTTSGMGFGVNERTTLSIKEGAEKEAVEWAKENYEHILTVKKPELNKILKPMLEMPKFIERVVTRYLSVRTTEE